MTPLKHLVHSGCSVVAVVTRSLQEEPRPEGPHSGSCSALTGRLSGLRLWAAMIEAPRRPGLLHQTMNRFISFACLLATWGLCRLGGFDSEF